MLSGELTAKIILISQWPNVKNGEYELIEKIKQTGLKITVVDFLGFDVETGKCINSASLSEEYDFAISFHYDTPKFLNIRTYLWVANPLEFMHLRGDYRPTLIHHLRAYDDFLYNGSDLLKEHISHVVGSEWKDSNLEMFPSSSISKLCPPGDNSSGEKETKLFYCGVNWERGIDRAGRAQGLLDLLQESKIADFYGPDKLDGISPWEGFTSYKGEIPFDGVSMTGTMRDYSAVLAVSSPAHMKSRTSSSRVFEGVAAGVPVISDENEHVRTLFGDSVYYFSGKDEAEKAESIKQQLALINSNKVAAQDRVNAAQKKMRERFCFEVSYRQVLEHQKKRVDRQFFESAKKADTVDIYLFHHDPNPSGIGAGKNFENLQHVLTTAKAAIKLTGCSVRLVICAENFDKNDVSNYLVPNLDIVVLSPFEISARPWDNLRLGDKVASLAKAVEGKIFAFFTQFDYPHYDYFEKAVKWFNSHNNDESNTLYLGGYFVNDLSQKAPAVTSGIPRNNLPVSMYRWTQNSLAEHQLGMMVFNQSFLPFLTEARLSRLDSILPVSIIAIAVAQQFELHRSRHILLRVQNGYFHRHYDAYTEAVKKGFWSQHYDLVTNYNHELNALFDQIHESKEATLIADHVSGHLASSGAVVDPAVHVVNRFIERLRPIHRKFRWVSKLILGWK